MNSQDTLFGDMDGGIHLYSGQANLVWPFSKSFTFHAGAKTSFVSIDNNADYNRLQGDSWQPDHDLSCDFQYDENINAGYVQLDAKILFYKSGGRSSSGKYPHRGRTIG